jgi:hypothetical protein
MGFNVINALVMMRYTVTTTAEVNIVAQRHIKSAPKTCRLRLGIIQVVRQLLDRRTATIALKGLL